MVSNYTSTASHFVSTSGSNSSSDGLMTAGFASSPLTASCSSRVICLTASVSGDELHEIFDAGAVACLMKDRALEEIVDAIHGAAGRAYG